MTTTKKSVKKMQTGGKATKKPTILRPDYRNLQLARSYNNSKLGNKLNTPATKQDSTDYKTGFVRGVKGWKPSANRLKYEGEGEYQKMGRWEGQNAKKEALSKNKTKGKVTKARNGKPVKKALLGSLLGGAGGSMLGGMGKQLLGGLAGKALGGLFGGGAGGGATAQGGQGETQAPMQKRKSTDTTPVKTRGMKKGGKVSKAKNGKSFPDLNKDGKITKADILKGRGVIAKKGMSVKKAQDGVKTFGANKYAKEQIINPKKKKAYVATNTGTVHSIDNKKMQTIDTTGYSKGKPTYELKESGKTTTVKRKNVKPLLSNMKKNAKMKSGGSMKKCRYGCK